MSIRTSPDTTLQLSSCIAKAVKATSRQMNCAACGWLCASAAPEQYLVNKDAHPHQHKYGTQNICGLSLSVSLSFPFSLSLSFSLYVSLLSVARACSLSQLDFLLLVIPLSFQSTLRQTLFDPPAHPDCLGHQSSTHLNQSNYSV